MTDYLLLMGFQLSTHLQKNKLNQIYQQLEHSALLPLVSTMEQAILGTEHISAFLGWVFPNDIHCLPAMILAYIVMCATAVRGCIV